MCQDECVVSFHHLLICLSPFVAAIAGLFCHSVGNKEASLHTLYFRTMWPRYYFTHLEKLKIDSALDACPVEIPSLTFSPETEAPLGRRDLPVFVAVAGVEEGSDADLVLVQVNSSQLSLVQIQVAVGVQP